MYLDLSHKLKKSLYGKEETKKYKIKYEIKSGES